MKEILITLLVCVVIYEIVEHIILPLFWTIRYRGRKSAYGPHGMIGKKCVVKQWTGNHFWHKTRYYCFISALMDVSSGTNISEQKLLQLIALSGRTDTDSDNMLSGSLETFRLWQYQISIAPNGDIIWKTCGGMGQIYGGPVIIESDILFLGPKKEKIEQQTVIVPKRHHSEYAKQAWSQITDYYSNTIDTLKARWHKREALKRKNRSDTEDLF